MKINKLARAIYKHLKADQRDESFDKIATNSEKDLYYNSNNDQRKKAIIYNIKTHHLMFGLKKTPSDGEPESVFIIKEILNSLNNNSTIQPVYFHTINGVQKPGLLSIKVKKTMRDILRDIESQRAMVMFFSRLNIGDFEELINAQRGAILRDMITLLELKSHSLVLKVKEEYGKQIRSW